MPIKILAIDDSKTMRLAIKITFAAEDAQVVAVSKGSEAIPRAKQHGADIILIDHTLAPGEPSGLQVVQELKANPATARIPVIMLIPARGGTSEADALAAGADAAIGKPFDTQELIDKVGAVLSGQKTTLAAPAVAAKPAVAPAAKPPVAATPAAKPPVAATPAAKPPAAATPAAKPPAAATPAAAKPVAAPPTAAKPAATPAAKPPVGATPAAAAKPAVAPTPVAAKPAVAPTPVAAKPTPAAATPAAAAKPAVTPAAAARPVAAQPVAAQAGRPGPIPIARPIPFTAANSPTAGMLERLRAAGGGAAAGLDPAAVRALLQLSQEVVEQVVWEVVPDLAEQLIKERLQQQGR
ncbi:response regulator [Nannocystaceae bacterium ST9]